MNQLTNITVPRRILGKTNLSVPVIPFGTQGFGNHFGFVDDDQAVSLVKHAISIGVNHFDCARCYGDSQRKLGIALRTIPRDTVVITGRLCCHSSAQWATSDGTDIDYSADRVERDIEDQLLELGISYFDAVLIHDPLNMEPTLIKDGTLSGLLKLKSRGLVNHIGYGMRPHQYHLEALATNDVDLMLCFSDYNLVRQTAANVLLKAASETGVGVMNGWSILRGLLTGADIPEASVKGKRNLNDMDRITAQSRLEWCNRHNIDLLQLAIQFCLREKRIHANPIGSLNANQLNHNVKAAMTTIDEDIWTKYYEDFPIN